MRRLYCVDVREAYELWFLGFVSGASHVYSNNGLAVGRSDATGVTTWVAKYCSDNPLDTVLTAATAVVTELRNRAK